MALRLSGAAFALDLEGETIAMAFATTEGGIFMVLDFMLYFSVRARCSSRTLGRSPRVFHEEVKIFEA